MISGDWNKILEDIGVLKQSESCGRKIGDGLVENIRNAFEELLE